MPLQATVRLRGQKELDRFLRKASPKQTPRILAGALTEAMLLVQASATTKHIIRGGRFRKKGKGSLFDAKVDPYRITSRSGRLRGSIGSSRAIDKSRLPGVISIGTNVVYAPVHEFGSKKGKPHARPFLQPALDEVEPKLIGIIVKHWRRSVDS